MSSMSKKLCGGLLNLDGCYPTGVLDADVFEGGHVFLQQNLTISGTNYPVRRSTLGR